MTGKITPDNRKEGSKVTHTSSDITGAKSDIGNLSRSLWFYAKTVRPNFICSDHIDEVISILTNMLECINLDMNLRKTNTTDRFCINEDHLLNLAAD